MKTFVLLTDFGLQDGYASVMEGVIRTLCSEPVNVIHLSHQIPPQNVKVASYLLWATYKFFPERTTFVVVVDPGVGTDRGIILAETKDYSFIAPNNGVLTHMLYEELKDVKTYEVDYSEFTILQTPIAERLPLKVSNTFHGRDIFAPLAVFYYKNREKVIENSKNAIIIPKSPFIVYTQHRSEYEVSVAYIDRFGNIITNLKFSEVPENIEYIIYNNIKIPFAPSFGYVNKGEFVAYIGSIGLLEIAINHGNAAKYLRISGNEKINIIIEVKS